MDTDIELKRDVVIVTLSEPFYGPDGKLYQGVYGTPPTADMENETTVCVGTTFPCIIRKSSIVNWVNCGQLPHPGTPEIFNADEPLAGIDEASGADFSVTVVTKTCVSDLIEKYVEIVKTMESHRIGANATYRKELDANITFYNQFIAQLETELEQGEDDVST